MALTAAPVQVGRAVTRGCPQTFLSHQESSALYFLRMARRCVCRPPERCEGWGSRDYGRL